MILGDPSACSDMQLKSNRRCELNVFKTLRFHLFIRIQENGVFEKRFTRKSFLEDNFDSGDRKCHLRVDANPKGKRIRFQKYPDTCGPGP